MIAGLLLTLATFGATAAPAQAAGCGWFGLFACPADPSARTPGAPVDPVKQVNRSIVGRENPRVGEVPPTREIGVPDPGVVPVVGKASAKADDGAYVVYETRMTDRIVDLMVDSPAVGGPVPVRVQLPPSWDSSSTRTYPVLYLLHGGFDPSDYQSWSIYSNALRTLRGEEALIVMPSLGFGGHATNYWNYWIRSSLQYMDWVAKELPQIMKRGYRASETASVAGASAGGRSALEVAYQNQGKYRAAASYSGLLDTQSLTLGLTYELLPLVGLQAPYQLWGSQILQRGIWNDRNPAKNLSRLRGTDLFVSAGDGSAPGPLDGQPRDFLSGVTESFTGNSTTSFVKAARAYGLPMTVDLYGAGTHEWPYFEREFDRSLPILLRGLGLR